MHYSRLGQQTVNAVRLMEVVQVFAKHGFAGLLRRAGLHQGWPGTVLRGLRIMEEPEGAPETFGERLRAALVELGPTFVKFGQILSTRPDLVTHAIAQDLSLLQDQVPPLPYEPLRAVIQAELGGTPESIFATFDTAPVASASISLVYRATLPSGEAVAVKVQRPNIEKIIESDLSLMRQIASWVAEYATEARWLDPPGIVDAFARSIRRELDFRVEARIIDQFRANFAEEENVLIPGVYHDFSSERVITMEWIDGDRIDNLDAFAARRSDPAEVARVGADALCKMVFEHHLFHADPHPGNMFVLDDNRVAFLDLGMAGHLERTDVAAIADLMLAIFHGESSACVRAILVLTTGEPPDDLRGMESEVAEFIAFEAQSIIGGGQVVRGIERAVQILRRYGLELAPRFTLLLKALGTIEVVGRTVDPKMDIVPIMQPYLEKLLLSRFQPGYFLKEAQTNMAGLLRLTREAPADLAYTLQQLRKGKLRLHLHHDQLEQLAAVIDRASSRSTLGTIIGALVIGSSLLISVESRISHLGLAGFLCAGLLGVYVIVNILRSKKF